MADGAGRLLLPKSAAEDGRTPDASRVPVRYEFREASGLRVSSAPLSDVVSGRIVEIVPGQKAVSAPCPSATALQDVSGSPVAASSFGWRSGWVRPSTFGILSSFGFRNSSFRYVSSRLPSSARLNVSSSANSRPVPAGKPCAMRVIFNPARASRFAR